MSDTVEPAAAPTSPPPGTAGPRPEAESPHPEQDLPGDLPADLVAAIARVEEALAAMAAGDADPYRRCWADTDDSTLYGAFGTIERGSAAIYETLGWVASRFADGELHPHYDVVHASGDLAYTVGRELGSTRLDGGEPRPLVIRVTHVYRRFDGRGWKLVHRHGDHPPRLER